MCEKEEEETSVGTDTMLFLKQQICRQGYMVETNEDILYHIKDASVKIWEIASLSELPKKCYARNCGNEVDVCAVSVVDCDAGECCIFPTCLQHALSIEPFKLYEEALLTRIPKHFLLRDASTMPSLEYTRLISLNNQFEKLTTFDNINKVCGGKFTLRFKS